MIASIVGVMLSVAKARAASPPAPVQLAPPPHLHPSSSFSLHLPHRCAVAPQVLQRVPHWVAFWIPRRGQRAAIVRPRHRWPSSFPHLRHDLLLWCGRERVPVIHHGVIASYGERVPEQYARHGLHPRGQMRLLNYSCCAAQAAGASPIQHHLPHLQSTCPAGRARPRLCCSPHCPPFGGRRIRRRTTSGCARWGRSTARVRSPRTTCGRRRATAPRCCSAPTTACATTSTGRAATW